MTSETARAQFAITFEGAKAPKRVQLFPAGPKIEAVDGRSWMLSDPQRLVEAFKEHGIPLVIDYEHASAIKAPEGEEAPAAGWINAIDVAADGSVWGDVDWTARGAAMIEKREYRFLSPDFAYHRDSFEIQRLQAAGLVNRPALTTLKALAREEEDTTMDLTAICRSLGLVAAATPAQIVEAIDRLKSDVEDAKAETKTALAAAETPPLEKFIPRADYDKVKTDLAAARAKLDTVKKDDHEKAVADAINDAIKAGKIAPASKTHYEALCASTDGLEQFRKLVETMPVVTDGSGLDERKPGDASKALTDEQKAICRLTDISEEDFAKGLAEVA